MFIDLDDKPKRLLRNLPAQHLYLKMALTDDEINKQLDKIKSAELLHLFLACTAHRADKYLSLVRYRTILLSIKAKSIFRIS